MQCDRLLPTGGWTAFRRPNRQSAEIYPPFRHFAGFPPISIRLTMDENNPGI
jgi:hypothetical protein